MVRYAVATLLAVVSITASPDLFAMQNRTEQSEIVRTENAIAINNVTVIDGTGAPPRPNMTVLIRAGRIVALFPAQAGTIPPDSFIVDGDGGTLLPGFVMMHEHLFYPDSAGGYFADPEAFARLYLAGGATTIRTAGSIDPYADLATARAIAANSRIGPDIDVTGAYVEGKPPSVARMPVIDGADHAARFVDFWATEGVTSFKAYEMLKLDALAATVAAAHRHGMRVTGHLCAVSYAEAAMAGIDNIEHSFAAASDFVSGRVPGVCPPWIERIQSLNRLDPDGPEIGKLIRMLVEHKVALTSTLAIFETLAADRPLPDADALAPLSDGLKHFFQSTAVAARGSPFGPAVAALLPRLGRMERRCVREGGLLIAGSDPTGFGGVVPGSATARQYELMVEAGFTASEAIRAMTLNGAIYLGRADDIGSIETGKRADLVFVRGDLTVDPHALRSPEIIFKAGKGYSSRAIRAQYEGRIGIE